MHAQTCYQLLTSWELLLNELTYSIFILYSMMLFIPRNVRNMDSLRQTKSQKMMMGSGAQTGLLKMTAGVSLGLKSVHWSLPTSTMIFLG